jgi:hypothetical protein
MACYVRMAKFRQGVEGGDRNPRKRACGTPKVLARSEGAAASGRLSCTQTAAAASNGALRGDCGQFIIPIRFAESSLKTEEIGPPTHFSSDRGDAWIKFLLEIPRGFEMTVCAGVLERGRG